MHPSWSPTAPTMPGSDSVGSWAPPRAGADKLVFAATPATPFVHFGDWAEQLIAESTGKIGKGILPVVVDRPDARGFRPTTRRGPGHLGPALRLDSVRPASGCGVSVDGPLGGQLLLWEFATAVAGRLIGINPFDQPDVELARRRSASLS